MFQNHRDPILSLPCLERKPELQSPHNRPKRAPPKPTPNKTTMSSTAITVAGIAAQVFLSNDVPQSRLSISHKSLALLLLSSWSLLL